MSTAAKGPYEISTRPAQTADYRESFAWYISGPGTGGYNGGYFSSPFNLRVVQKDWNKGELVTVGEPVANPEWWDKAISLMNFAYEQGRIAERRHIRETIIDVLGIPRP